MVDDIFLNLPGIWTICMKCQNLFSGKNKRKYFKMLPAENLTQSAKHLEPFCVMLHNSDIVFSGARRPSLREKKPFPVTIPDIALSVGGM